MNPAGVVTKGPGVTTRELKDADFGVWRELLARSEQGSPYSLPEYLAALCGATGATWRVVGVFLDEQLVGGVALYETQSRAGRVVGNRTLLYYNGLVLDLPPKKFHSDRTSQMQSVLAALEQHLSGDGLRPRAAAL